MQLLYNFSFFQLGTDRPKQCLLIVMFILFWWTLSSTILTVTRVLLQSENTSLSEEGEYISPCYINPSLASPVLFPKCPWQTQKAGERLPLNLILHQRCHSHWMRACRKLLLWGAFISMICKVKGVINNHLNISTSSIFFIFAYVHFGHAFYLYIKF